MTGPDGGGDPPQEDAVAPDADAAVVHGDLPASASGAAASSCGGSPPPSGPVIASPHRRGYVPSNQKIPQT